LSLINVSRKNENKKKLSRARGLIFIFFGLLVFVLFQGSHASDDAWMKERGKHFIVCHSSRLDASFAREILRKAEKYYDKIANNLNYSRYRNFWTWDHRVNIFIYDDQEAFIEKTKQPRWSKGGALREDNLLKTRTIVTYKQEDGFLDGVLPHEISHLILKDFIGFDRDIPIWFHEGVAQLQEKGKPAEAQRVMKIAVANGIYIPLEILMIRDIRHISNPQEVVLFYAQSFSIVNFLIKQYGSNQFGKLCMFLKEGYPFQEALSKAYYFNFSSIATLEKKWLRYMEN